MPLKFFDNKKISKICKFSGLINLKKEIQPEEMTKSYCATVKAIDEYGRSETAVVTIGLDGFVRECDKIVNFNDLQPLTYIPPQSHLSEINGDTKHTSEIQKLFRLSYITTSSLSSTFPSTEAKIVEAETSEIGGYRITPSITRKHGYTKLIATQSIFDSNGRFNSTSDSSGTVQSSSTAASESTADSLPDLSVNFGTSSATDATENNLEGRYFFGEFSSTDVSKNVNISTGKPYEKYVTGSTEENSLTSHEKFKLNSIKPIGEEIQQLRALVLEAKMEGF